MDAGALLMDTEVICDTCANEKAEAVKPPPVEQE